MTQEAPRWILVTEWDEQERGPRVVNRLEDFNGLVKDGDPIVIIREEYLAFGRFRRWTEGRFNLDEHHIDLQEAAVFPVNVTGANPRGIADLLSMVDLETKNIEVDLSNGDFLIYRIC